MREACQQQLQHAAGQHQQRLAAAASESAAALSRHMDLIDRLMQERQGLRGSLEEAQQATKVCVCARRSSSSDVSCEPPLPHRPQA